MNKKSLFLAVVLSFSFMVSSEQRIEASANDKKDLDGIAKWSYKGEMGPEHWGDLDPSFIACKNGKEQSPINIEYPQVKTTQKLKNFLIDYRTTPFSVVNNGHTIQANTTELGNRLIIGEKEYTLSQFHFHDPSEHQLNGQNFDMEIHLLHQDEIGNGAVVSVFITEGKEHQTVSSLWRQLRQKSESNKLSVNLLTLLPSNKTFFHYMGSLTNPPCTENVKWVVLENPIEISREQIQAFKQIFGNNHRPVQPLNNREIRYGILEEVKSKTPN
nr:carbonic anhydrase family protein [Neobacillus sp. Marseille-Q6967]